MKLLIANLYLKVYTICMFLLWFTSNPIHAGQLILTPDHKNGDLVIAKDGQLQIDITTESESSVLTASVTADNGAQVTGSEPPFLVTFPEASHGKICTVVCNVTHEVDGISCTSSRDFTYKVHVPKLTPGILTGVPHSGTAPNRIPIYGGDSPIEGSLTLNLVPDLPNNMPPDQTLTIKIEPTGDGDAQFDDKTRERDITGVETVKLWGLLNSTSIDDIKIVPYLVETALEGDDVVYKFCVRTWPMEWEETFDGVSRDTLIFSYTYGSEAGGASFLPNDSLFMGEKVTYTSTQWAAPPYGQMPIGAIYYPGFGWSGTPTSANRMLTFTIFFKNRSGGTMGDRNKRPLWCGGKYDSDTAQQEWRFYDGVFGMTEGNSIIIPVKSNPDHAQTTIQRIVNNVKLNGESDYTITKNLGAHTGTLPATNLPESP